MVLCQSPEFIQVGAITSLKLTLILILTQLPFFSYVVDWEMSIVN